MVYVYETQESLKNAIRSNNLQEFQKIWNTVEDYNDKQTYLYGKKDENRSLLEWAAITKDSKDVMEYLIENLGAYVDHQDGKGRTSLSGAVEYNYIENVRFLLQKQANPNLQDYQGFTTLHVAAHGAVDEIFRLLFAKNADIKIVDKSGATALHIAAKYSLESLHAIVKYRLKDLDINQKDNNGDTPLHYSAEAEDKGVTAGYLLRLGADSTILNNDKKTAIDAEEEWSHEPMIANVILGYNGQKDHEDYYKEHFEVDTLGSDDNNNNN